MQKIRKAIIPVAGFGTRFLPATKAQPKEMLTLVDKPVIQYIVEEAVAAGIEEIIFVTSQNKRAIEDHFDRNFELEYRLRQKGDKKALEEIIKLSSLANFVYIRQKTPIGDGHAVLCAKDLIGDEPCAVLFGDDIIDGPKPCIGEMIKIYERYNDPVIAIKEVPKKEVSRWGVVDGIEIEPRLYQLKNVVEKPSVAEAPSNLVVIGKYIITPEVFAELGKVKPDKFGEIRLANALRLQLAKGKPVYGHQFSGQHLDCGTKLGFLKATVSFAMKHKELSGDFKKFLKETVK